MTTTTNKMVSANADFFIVPNSARKIDNCFFPEIELKEQKLCVTLTIKNLIKTTTS